MFGLHAEGHQVHVVEENADVLKPDADGVRAVTHVGQAQRRAEQLQVLGPDRLDGLCDSTQPTVETDDFYILNGHEQVTIFYTVMVCFSFKTPKYSARWATGQSFGSIYISSPTLKKFCYNFLFSVSLFNFSVFSLSLLLYIFFLSFCFQNQVTRSFPNKAFNNFFRKK